MVKILHTADIHLKEYKDERWEALEELVEIGKRNEVDIFTICGDLFDKDVDAENLRPKIREVFSNIPFKVLIIPGNHDAESYKGGMYFGEDVFILGTLPFKYGDVRIVGVPFEPIQGEKLLGKIRALKETLTPDKKNVLLCHGELLDAFFSRVDFGDEGEERYMPFKLSYFEGLNIDYVLAGHFHSKFDDRRLENGGYFVYPGSPVSITQRETGQRGVNLFEVGSPPHKYPLDTFHYQEITITLDPFKEENPVEIVQQHFEKLHPRASAILTVKGYVNSEKIQMTEQDIVSQIKETTKRKCAEEHYDFSDISRILENDLFKSFTNKVKEGDYTEERERQLQDIAIKAMMQAGL
jgi:DNA repair exonuclease SbcCD nuclease subunit